MSSVDLNLPVGKVLNPQSLCANNVGLSGPPYSWIYEATKSQDEGLWSSRVSCFYALFHIHVLKHKRLSVSVRWL